MTKQVMWLFIFFAFILIPPDSRAIVLPEPIDLLLPCVAPFSRLLPFASPIYGGTCCDAQDSYREISSSAVPAALAETPVTQLLYYWGQLVYNDIVGIGNGTVSPASCPSTSEPTPGLNLSSPCNWATPALDASFLYGNNPLVTDSLRTFHDGKLNLTHYGVLPRTCDPDIVPKFTGPNPLTQYIDIPCAGDPRAAATLQVLALQTLLVMEHNRHCDRLALEGRYRGRDDLIFAAARQIVTAIVQKITMEEWLPLIAGSQPIPPYHPAPAGAGPPSTLLEFAILFPLIFASGSSDRVLYSDQNQELSHIPLDAGFFNPQAMHYELGGGDGVCTVLTGMLRDPLNRMDEAPQMARGLLEAQLPATLCEDYRAVGLDTFENIALSLGVAWPLPPVTDDDILDPLTRALVITQLTNYTRNRDPNWYQKAGVLTHRRRTGVEQTTLANILSANCKFIENLDSSNEFTLWAVSDIKVIEQNNSNLNRANMGALIFFVVLIGVSVFGLGAWAIWVWSRATAPRGGPL